MYEICQPKGSLLCSLLKASIILPDTFKSMIHLELIFVYSMS